MSGQIQYGAGGPMTSAATPSVPPPGDPAAARVELSRKRVRFRHELHGIGSRPTNADLDRVLTLARELGLRDEDIRDELAQIGVSREAIAFTDQIARNGLPDAEAIGTLPPGERCHFVAPVQLGSRRSDQQFGHLALTSGWAKFHGATDVSLAWSEVATVERAGRDIVITVHDSRRLLRFRCHTFAEAARGVVIAQYLAAHVGV